MSEVTPSRSLPPVILLSMRIRWLEQLSPHFFTDEEQRPGLCLQWPHQRPCPYIEWHGAPEYLDPILERLSVKLGIPRTTDIGVVLGEVHARIPSGGRHRPWLNLSELAVLSSLPLDGWVHVLGERDIPDPESEDGYRREPGAVLIHLQDLIAFEGIFIGEYGWILDEHERWIIRTFEQDGFHAYGDIYRF